MQDGGHAQLVDVLQLKPYRAKTQLFVLGQFGQRGQRHALERNRVTRPQRGQVSHDAVVAQHHGQACQTAFSGLGLQYHGQPTAQPY